MRLAELSERSGVSIATIKYYLRERLLPPGHRVSATLAEYDEDHLRRLRFVRALIQVGKVPVANARQVLEYVDDESLGLTMRLGAALWSLPENPGAGGTGEAPESSEAPGTPGTLGTSGATGSPGSPDSPGSPGSSGAESAAETKAPMAAKNPVAAKDPMAAKNPAAADARRTVDELLEQLGWTSAREIGALSPVHRSLVTAVETLLRLGLPCDLDILAPRARLMQQVAVHDLDLLETLPSEAAKVEAAVASAVLFEPVLTALHRLAQEEESSRRYGLV